MVGRRGLFAAAPDDAGALAALAERDEKEPLEVSDGDLLAVRTALLALPALQRDEIGNRVGRVLLVDGYRWEQDKRIAEKCGQLAPTFRQTSHGTRGAGLRPPTAPGIAWIDPRYDGVLREGAPEGTRARAFFRLLGAEVAPRLEDPSHENCDFRYGSHAARISADAPSMQMEALEGMYATHLLHDQTSPDLSRVLVDIERRSVDKQRRQRARALMETLERSWGRLGDHATASAVWGSGTWRSPGEVPATWLAETASRQWMSNKRGQKRAPRELAVQTPGTESVFGRDPKRYGFEVDKLAADSPVLAALGIHGEPPVSAILAELQGLRDHHRDEVGWADVEGHYAAIASRCPARGSSASDDVGDTPIRDLKRAFGTSTGDGLILTPAGWSIRHRYCADVPSSVHGVDSFPRQRTSTLCGACSEFANLPPRTRSQWRRDWCGARARNW